MKDSKRYSFSAPWMVLAGGVAVYLGHEGSRRAVNKVVLLAAQADVTPVGEYLLGFGWWAPLVSALLQLVTSIFAPLPSLVIVFANAMLFGLWWGGLLTWSSALLGAAICFGIARRFGRPVVERFVPRGALESVDRFFVERGAVAVLVARILPFINPDVVSYASGLTPMSLPIFLGSVAVGSLPSTILYSYLGSRGVTTVGWLFGPLLVLGILAFAAGMMRRPRPPTISQVMVSGDD